MAQGCQTCLQVIDSNSAVYYYFDTIYAGDERDVTSIRDKLIACIPEFLLHSVHNAVMCQDCCTALAAAYKFKQHCLQSQEKIRTFLEHVEDNTGNINMGEIALHYQTLQGVDLKVGNSDSAQSDKTNLPCASSDAAENGMIDEADKTDLPCTSADLTVNETHDGAGEVNMPCTSPQSAENEMNDRAGETNLPCISADLTVNETHDGANETNLPCTSADLTEVEMHDGVGETNLPCTSSHLAENTTNTDTLDDKSNLKEVVIAPNEMSTISNELELTHGMTSTNQKKGKSKKDKKGPKRYICTLCRYSCIHTCSFHCHMIMHKKSFAPYTCDECGEILQLPRQLLEHLAKHTNEKFYPCGHCEYYTVDAEKFKKHGKIHSQPFKCNTCGRRYAKECFLHNHIDSHKLLNKAYSHCEENGEKYYRCHICPFKCLFHSRMRKHDKTMHRTCAICKNVCDSAKSLRNHFVQKHRNVSF